VTGSHPASAEPRRDDGHRRVPLQPARAAASVRGPSATAAGTRCVAVRVAEFLGDLHDALEDRDWLALVQRLTLAGALGAGGFLAGLALGVAVTLVGMAPGWVGQPVSRAAAVLSALPLPRPLTVVAVLAAGYVMVRVRWCGRWLLALSRLAVALLALAVAWQMVRG
jgi:hypothetical protein